MKVNPIHQIVRHASLRQLQVFEAIARCSSFTRAAEELHLTQPTVSMQIKKLEECIGVALFEHVGKKIYLTRTGELLQAAAVDVLRTLANFDMAVADEKGLKTGQLKLAVVTAAKYFAPRVLGKFSAIFPGVDLSLKVTNRERILERMAKNTDDLYIVGNPPMSDEYEFASLIDNPIVVVAPLNHPLAAETNIPLRRFAQEPFIIREQGSGTRMAVEALFATHQCKLNVRMDLGSNEAIKQAVASGLGVSALSENLLSTVGEVELAKLDVEHFPIPWHWYVGYPSGKQLSIIARTFLEFMNDEVENALRTGEAA